MLTLLVWVCEQALIICNYRKCQVTCVGRNVKESHHRTGSKSCSRPPATFPSFTHPPSHHFSSTFTGPLSVWDSLKVPVLTCTGRLLIQHFFWFVCFLRTCTEKWAFVHFVLMIWLFQTGTTWYGKSCHRWKRMTAHLQWSVFGDTLSAVYIDQVFLMTPLLWGLLCGLAVCVCAQRIWLQRDWVWKCVQGKTFAQGHHVPTKQIWQTIYNQRLRTFSCPIVKVYLIVLWCVSWGVSILNVSVICHIV